MTPADEIREAAQRMRTQAQAVEHFTSPWTTCADDTDGWYVAYNTSNPNAGLLATVADYGGMHLADYIATMHPRVGLALADWLDEAAAHTQALRDLATRMGDDPDTYTPRQAHAVAQAILGEQVRADA